MLARPDRLCLWCGSALAARCGEFSYLVIKLSNISEITSKMSQLAEGDL